MKKLNQNKILGLIIVVGAMSLISGCDSGGGSSGGSSSSESASEIAAAAAVGGSNSGGNVGFNSVDPLMQRSFLAKVQDFLMPVSSAIASAACPYYIVGSTSCSGNAVTFSYNDCSFGNSVATWVGSQTLQFGGGATCDTSSLPLTGSGTLTRTFGGDTVRVSPFGLAVTLNTSDSTGYYQAVSGGFLITGVAGGHQIAIDGINISSTRWNWSVSTSSDLQVSIDGSGNRTFTSGVVQIQHNLARYLGEASFDNVYVPAGSCFPSSGSVTTTFSGSRSGSETLVFNGGSSATLTVNGVSSPVTLSHCF